MADDSQLAEATQALSFAEFLERMKDPQAANLVRSIRKCAVHRASLRASHLANCCDGSIPSHRYRLTRRIACCSFIKTFDDKAGNPDKDAESVQVEVPSKRNETMCALFNQSCRLQGFLAKSEGIFRDHPVWANVPVEHQSQAMEVMRDGLHCSSQQQVAK